jgi:CBS-domain-containing membrane protein
VTGVPRLRIFAGWAGSFLAILLIAGLAQITKQPLILGSFGASCVLLFGFPEGPFSQPRNLVLGHVLASAIGLVALTLFGPGTLPMALATATAVAAMMALRCVHPPAGSNPVIIFLTQPDWTFLLMPAAAGSVLLLLAAMAFNNIGTGRRYPLSWWK